MQNKIKLYTQVQNTKQCDEYGERQKSVAEQR
jgi:hypothetical protein